MPPKPDLYSFNQIKEIMEKNNEETLMKFLNATIERMDKKIQDLANENVLLKKEVADVKISLQFHSDIFDKKVSENVVKLKETGNECTVDSRYLEHSPDQGTA